MFADFVVAAPTPPDMETSLRLAAIGRINVDVILRAICDEIAARSQRRVREVYASAIFAARVRRNWSAG